jgi:hypothetical protein
MPLRHAIFASGVFIIDAVTIIAIILLMALPHYACFHIISLACRHYFHYA